MKILIRSLLAKGKGLGSLKKISNIITQHYLIRAPIPRAFRYGKKKETHWWGSVSMLFIVRTHLTSRPTWNDSTGRCSYELTNNIKIPDWRTNGGRLFLHLAKRLETAHADDNYFRRQREPFFTPFFFFFRYYSVTQSFRTYPSDRQKPLDNYPNGLEWLVDRLFSMAVCLI